jgi:hypothetical protein
MAVTFKSISPNDNREYNECSGSLKVRQIEYCNTDNKQVEKKNPPEKNPEKKPGKKPGKKSRTEKSIFQESYDVSPVFVNKSKSSHVPMPANEKFITVIETFNEVF